ncbi:MAG TPA: LamG domain-containing protein [Sedimentisphaerales bacterium]|nr:LamG domain-containing protein [Sedimentisphaerales bacterium]
MCKRLIYLFSFVLVTSLIITGLAEGADPSLVAWYRFDGNALDSSGNELHGTEMGNPTYEAGVFGQAISLDGDGDYVDCGAPPEFDITDYITFTYWIKVVEFDKEWNTVLSRGDNSWRSSRAGLNNFMEAAVDGTTGGYTYGVTPVDDGEWHHVGWVYDGTMNYLYVDGEVDATEASTGQITVSSFPLYIGDNSDATGRFWTGLIDDVQIYNRALSQEEVQRVMQASAGAFPQAAGPVPADGTLHEDTWVNLSWRAGDFAVSHDVYLGDNFDDVNDGAEGTFQGNQASTFFVAGFPGFAYPDGLVPGTTYYWRIDEVNDTEPNSPWKGDVWSFSVPPKTAYAPDPADAAEQVDPDADLSWTGGFGAKLHTVYFGDNFNDVDNAAGGLPQGVTTYSPGTLKLAKTYYWRVDEFDAVETYKGDVWSFTTQGAVGNPNPANGAVDVKQTQIISWSPGVFAASHQVYFGADKEAVKNADTGSPEYKGTGDLGAESYDPGKLEWDTTYYWRIDEVNNTNADSPWTGILWSFTTANFLIVDDFESYNDLDPTDPDSNRIFNAWIDGYDDPTNGSLVGYDNPPFAEQTIVHGGNQSLPLYYDNSVGYSEATLTLTYPRDWTENGVSTLTIWFRGNSDNAAETLYVALNGSAIVTNDNPDAAQITAWTEWTIDLQAFGVNLADVNTIALGLGNKNNPAAGGSGTMYFDDIRLYPPAP